jgi:hypothetical protein
VRNVWGTSLSWFSPRVPLPHEPRANPRNPPALNETALPPASMATTALPLAVKLARDEVSTTAPSWPSLHAHTTATPMQLPDPLTLEFLQAAALAPKEKALA